MINHNRCQPHRQQTRPTVLEVAVRRYRCTGCGHVWRQNTTRTAPPRAKLSRRAPARALEGLVAAP